MTAAGVALYAIVAAAWVGNPDARSFQQHLQERRRQQEQQQRGAPMPAPPAWHWPQWRLLTSVSSLLAPAQHPQLHSFGVFTLAETEAGWFVGSAFGGWAPLLAGLGPAAAAAAAASEHCAAWARGAAAWLYWLLWEQYGLWYMLTAVRITLETSLAHTPPGATGSSTIAMSSRARRAAIGA